MKLIFVKPNKAQNIDNIKWKNIPYGSIIEVESNSYFTMKTFNKKYSFNGPSKYRGVLTFCTKDGLLSNNFQISYQSELTRSLTKNVKGIYSIAGITKSKLHDKTTISELITNKEFTEKCFMYNNCHFLSYGYRLSELTAFAVHTETGVIHRFDISTEMLAFDLKKIHLTDNLNRLKKLEING